MYVLALALALWMVKEVFVTKENSHTSFLYVKHFYKVRGGGGGGSGVSHRYLVYASLQDT